MMSDAIVMTMGSRRGRLLVALLRMSGVVWVMNDDTVMRMGSRRKRLMPGMLGMSGGRSVTRDNTVKKVERGIERLLVGRLKMCVEGASMRREQNHGTMKVQRDDGWMSVTSDEEGELSLEWK